MSHSETVRRIFSDSVNFPGISPDMWKPETRFDALSFDSLDMVEGIMAIEGELGIEITDRDVEGVQTFGQLVELVDKIVGP